MRAWLRSARAEMQVLSWTWRERLRWSIRRPVLLNDKIRYKMAMDRRTLITTFADKWAVREYVAAQVGPDILNTVYMTTQDPREIDFRALPDRFVVKPTHGSGAVIILDRAADPASALPAVKGRQGWIRTISRVHPDHVDRDTFDQLCLHWLENEYQPWEWAYRNVPPRLIVEKFIEDGSGRAPADYKFNTYHGKVRWIEYHGGRDTGHNMSLRWPDWSPIPTKPKYPEPEVPPPPPDHLAEMIRISETLGAETDMVRVDLYEVDGQILFGELTNYCGGGTHCFDPPEYERILAETWTPPRIYR